MCFRGLVSAVVRSPRRFGSCMTGRLPCRRQSKGVTEGRFGEVRPEFGVRIRSRAATVGTLRSSIYGGFKQPLSAVAVHSCYGCCQVTRRTCNQCFREFSAAQGVHALPGKIPLRLRSITCCGVIGFYSLRSGCTLSDRASFGGFTSSRCKRLKLLQLGVLTSSFSDPK